MKLFHPYFETPIDLLENHHDVLIVENPKTLSEIIREYHDQMNGYPGRFVLSEDDKTLNIASVSEVIIDYFSIDINQRKVINGVYHQIKEIAIGESRYMATQEARSLIEQFVAKLLEESELPLNYSLQWDLESLFKTLEVAIDNRPTDTLLEVLIDYLEVCRNILKKKLFILVNAKSWLNLKQISDLYQYIEYNKFSVLFIESFQRYETILKSEVIRIIDDDNCVI